MVELLLKILEYSKSEKENRDFIKVITWTKKENPPQRKSPANKIPAFRSSKELKKNNQF